MGKRRSFTPEFKAQLVLAVLTGQRNPMDLTREHQIKPQQISEWKSEFVTNAPLIFQRNAQTDAIHARLAELERLVGRLTLELEASKKVSQLLSAAGTRNGRSS